MSGTFTIGEKKIRPGTYFRRENSGGPDVAGAINGYAAAVFQSDWGPLNQLFDMDVSMQNDISDYYGTDEHTRIIKEAFTGGATTVRAIRCGDDDGEPMTVTLEMAESPTVEAGAGEGAASGDGADLDAPDSGSSTPAASTTNDAVNGVVITAAYPGTRPFAVSVRTNLITDQRECVIYDGTVIFEKVSFEAGNNEAANLVAAMSASKNFIAKISGTATGKLKTVTQVPMEGGKNPTVTTASYDRAFNALERVKWNCLIVDTDDAAVHLLVQSFIQQSYEQGHFGIGCIAGLPTQDFDERTTLAALFNDEKMAYIVNGGWLASDGTEYKGYIAAARIGGMIASFETNSSLTHTVIKGAVKLLEPLTNGEMIKAEKKGCICLSLNDDDQVWLDNAINTLVTPDVDQDEGWKKLRRTKCRFELMDRVNTTTDKLVGKVNNDTDGRQTVMAAAQKVLNTMTGEKKIMDNSYIYEDPANPAEGDNAWYKLAIDDIDSQEHIYLTYQFRFSPNS
ncbi:MAG: phage tail sheath subtilisin-like domain-containing protein [Schwartzia sp.]|nr:phage tail sheath subtilisin-like domain-containing protein [Schwartzia sp. (in: firmicutes)]